MGSKVIRNITKVFKSASGVLFGRATAGTGRGEELTPAQVCSLLSVYTISQTDTAISTAVNNLVAGAPGLLDTLDELSAALGDDANFASTVTTALAGKAAVTHQHTTADITGFGEAVDDEVATLLVAGTNITITYDDAANTLTIASTAGGLSGTGSVDNAVLRADGVGGATLQSSAIVIDDLYTTSPNNTVNFVSMAPTGGTTNVGFAIVPKGSGAFAFDVPDGTTTGGNARGAFAIDLQFSRSSASQVASGQDSICIGRRNTASNPDAIAIGNQNVSSGLNGWTSIAFGSFNTASGDSSIVIGFNSVATVLYAFAEGAQSRADRHGMYAFASGQFAATGDAQSAFFVLRNRTTNSTPTTLFLNGSTSRLTIPSGKMLSVQCRISGVKSDGTAVADYVRRVVIKNVSGTTSLVGSVETIGTDIEDNASTDVAITADDTNDALQINVTGITGETWRWVAVVEGLEIAYGV